MVVALEVIHAVWAREIPPPDNHLPLWAMVKGWKQRKGKQHSYLEKFHLRMGHLQTEAEYMVDDGDFRGSSMGRNPKWILPHFLRCKWSERSQSKERSRNYATGMNTCTSQQCTSQVRSLEELPWDYQPDKWSLKKPLSISGDKEQVSFKGIPWCNCEHSELWIQQSENWVGPFWLIRTRTLFTPLIGPVFQLPCPPVAWFTRTRWTSVGPTQGVLAGPRRLCTSLAIRGLAPALPSIPRPCEQRPSQCHPLIRLPRVLGAKGRSCDPWVWPLGGLHTTHLVTAWLSQ